MTDKTKFIRAWTSFFGFMPSRVLIKKLFGAPKQH